MKNYKALFVLSTICLTQFSKGSFAEWSPDTCLSCNVIEPKNSGLKLCLPFNGNAIDESGNNHSGTVNGAVLTEDRFGNPNKAYLFDGMNDEILLANPSGLAYTSYTYSMWYRAIKNGDGQTLISIGGSTSDQVLQLYYTNNQVNVISYYGAYPNIYNASAGAPGSNTWNHLVYTKGDNGIKLYINGVLVGSNASAIGTPVYLPSATNASIGSRGNLQFFGGTLDDIRIYDRVLSEIEVKALFDPCNPLGLEYFNDDTNLEIYPNPANNRLFIKSEVGGLNYIIRNTLGIEINSGAVYDSSINLTELQAGFYFITFTGSQNAVLKTLKLHVLK